MVERTAMLHYLTLQTLLALSISCFWSPFWGDCCSFCSFAGSLRKRRKNGTGRFRNGGSISKKPTREPAAMRTIKPGKAGVTSITADGEINCCTLVYGIKRDCPIRRGLVSGGTGSHYFLPLKIV